MDNESITLKKITFYGYTLPYLYYSKKNIEQSKVALTFFKLNKTGFKNNNYNIILSHTPIIFENADLVKEVKNVDLVLSGHMHNGVIPIVLDKIFKGSKGIISPTKNWFPNYARGRIVLNKNTNLIISKGITTFQKTAPFICRIFNFLYPSNIEYINVELKNEKNK